MQGVLISAVLAKENKRSLTYVLEETSGLSLTQSCSLPNQKSGRQKIKTKLALHCLPACIAVGWLRDRFVLRET